MFKSTETVDYQIQAKFPLLSPLLLSPLNSSSGSAAVEADSTGRFCPQSRFFRGISQAP